MSLNDLHDSFFYWYLFAYFICLCNFWKNRKNIQFWKKNLFFEKFRGNLLSRLTYFEKLTGNLISRLAYFEKFRGKLILRIADFTKFRGNLISWI